MALPSIANMLGLTSGDPPIPKAAPNQSALVLSWKNASGALETVRFDAVTTESHEGSMNVTDHAVEIGANVVDHAREMPDILTIEGFVSSKPLSSNAPGLLAEAPFDLKLPKKDVQISVTAITGAIDNLLSPPPSQATVQQASGSFPTRVRDMFEKLTAARRARVLITAISAIDQVDSMLLTRVTVPRTHADGTGATFHLELRKIRLVSSESADAPDPVEKRAEIEANKGSQGKKELPKKVGDSIILGVGKWSGWQH